MPENAAPQQFSTTIPRQLESPMAAAPDAVIRCSPGCSSLLTEDESRQLLGTSCHGFRLKDGSFRRRRNCYCGFRTGHDCPRPFNISDIEKSARSRDDLSLEDPLARNQTMSLDAARMLAEARCQNINQSQVALGALPTGGWCLTPRRTPHDSIRSDHDAAIMGHRPGSTGLAMALDWLLKLDSRGRQSLIEFGAGLGQDARLLLALDSAHDWRGYDGAGNVESMTRGFVRFADMSWPLFFRRAHWVLTVETGEHVPRRYEGMFMRNIHAHNCIGVVLSWARLDQGGHGHVNTHDPAYVRGVFADLDYLYDGTASQRMNELFHGTALVSRQPMELQVLRRRVPLNGCSAS
mmetsp:Transcript_39767/g.65928  ORF Transcript_39767/g.65928 Transcript_39767/m.65928 type:complete len:350 (+) Transcript_39767:91-1140(+)